MIFFGNKNDPGGFKRIQREIEAAHRDYYVSKVNVKALIGDSSHRAFQLKNEIYL